MEKDYHSSKNNIILTNDNCIGCNRCIGGCPIIGANVSSIENGVNTIGVNPD